MPEHSGGQVLAIRCGGDELLEALLEAVLSAGIPLSAAACLFENCVFACPFKGRQSM